MADETALAVSRLLADAYPTACCELLARDPWDLLVAAILSARTSDTRVNEVMAVLSEHLVGPTAYALMEVAELDRLIQRLPLHRQKARAIIDAAHAVLERHDGRVPADEEALCRLPGVGRKTAAVVLGNAYQTPAIAADVHVRRIVCRLGWSERDEAGAVERAVARRLPPHHWVDLCHRMIRLGRDTCRPRRPWCSRCPLAGPCPRRGVDDAR